MSTLELVPESDLPQGRQQPPYQGCPNAMLRPWIQPYLKEVLDWTVT